MNTLRKAIQKINYACGDCRGTGKIVGKDIWINVLIQPHNPICKTCLGTGIDIPLEFGCEVTSETMGSIQTGIIIDIDKTKDYLYYNTTWGGFSVDGFGKIKSPYVKNLGKPSTLEDLLRALPQLELEFIDLLGKNLYISYDDHKSIKYDLSKTVETQTQEVTDQLIEILT